LVDWQKLMNEAIAVCRRGIDAGQSPFGAAIATRGGQVICSTHNTVRAECDATAHAEINAIREACRRLGTIDLSGHVLATTCEPCPMCAAAIHWARLDAIAFGATIAAAQAAGFNELAFPSSALYEHGGSRVEVHAGVLRDACRGLFDEWLRGPHPQPY
jgi:tRNA(Arg) A34 adenosine deaminase TadA